MKILNRFNRSGLFNRRQLAETRQHEEALAMNLEYDLRSNSKGRIATPENSIKHLYNQMHVGP